MPRTLTIFIDGIPFDQLHKMEYSREFKSRARLIPILGYSVNCQTQLFTGKSPDEIGFWCEWTYDPEGSPFRRLRWLLPILSLSEIWYPAKRVVHRLLDRLRWTSGTKNIPLRYLADFAETGHSVFSPYFRDASLLDHAGLSKFLHLEFPNTPKRDLHAFEAAKGHIDASADPGHVLVTFTKVDHCSHWDGVASPPYDTMLRENDRYIRELSESFRAKCPDGTVLVVSDHGMSNIEKHVTVDLEARFGRPGPSRYAYFSEGTLLRVWLRDGSLREPMREHLGGIDGLEEAGAEDLREWGITRPEFGDLIYATRDGHQLLPSFWGPKPSVGMHGHHPRYASQHGICLSTREGDFGGEVRAADFHRVLSGYLESA